MSIKTKMNVGIHCIYQKYGKDMREAHQQLLQLESVYKSKTDAKIVENKIFKIIDEVIDDN
ncbi:MAG: hypothetical protein ACRC6T_15500 [Sarcina sp.]